MEPMRTGLHDAHRHRRARTKGVSLVEMIAVMAIMAIVCVATIPNLESLSRASAITQGGQEVAEEINLARQMASTRNSHVQVRLIALAKVADPSATGFNAVQTWGTDSDTGEPIALDRINILPDGVVISQDAVSYSPLLTITGNTVANGSSGLAALPQMTVPRGLAYFASVCIAPSGMPCLSAGTSTSQRSLMAGLYLSIVPSYFGSASTPPSMTSSRQPGAPADYLVVQINPDTGNPLVYRP